MSNIKDIQDVEDRIKKAREYALTCPVIKSACDQLKRIHELNPPTYIYTLSTGEYKEAPLPKSAQKQIHAIKEIIKDQHKSIARHYNLTYSQTFTNTTS